MTEIEILITLLVTGLLVGIGMLIWFNHVGIRVNPFRYLNRKRRFKYVKDPNEREVQY